MKGVGKHRDRGRRDRDIDEEEDDAVMKTESTWQPAASVPRTDKIVAVSALQNKRKGQSEETEAKPKNKNVPIRMFCQTKQGGVGKEEERGNKRD
jgi:hypothetical protein